MAVQSGHVIYLQGLFLIVITCEQVSFTEKKLRIGKHWGLHLKYISHPLMAGSSQLSLPSGKKKNEVKKKKRYKDFEQVEPA